VAGELFLSHCCLGFAKATQRNAITHQADSTIHVAAPFGVIDAVAIADIEAAPAAILPNRVLDEPGKGLRKARIELPGIDPLGDGLNNVGRSRPAGSRPRHTSGSR
jgi:hypothetical protein